MTSHYQPLTQTLIIYLVMGAAYYGWGRAAAYVLGIGQQTNRSDITLIWLGWAFTLFIFSSCISLSPVTASIVAPIFIHRRSLLYPSNTSMHAGAILCSALR